MNLSKISKSINIPVIADKCRQVYREHSDLVFQISIIALNSMVLISKVYSKESPLFAKFTYASYNFVGVIFINRQIKDLTKSCKDFKYCLQAKDREKIIISALKTSYLAINILLTGSLFVAAIFSLFSYPTIAITIYSIIKPFAIYSLVVEIGAQLYNYKINQDLKVKFKSINSDQKIEKIAKHFISLVKQENCPEEIDKNLKKFSLHIFCQLDDYMIKQLKKNVSEIDLNSFFDKLKTDIDKRCTFTKADLALMATGYACLGVGRLWPESLAQSAANLFISVLHLINLINLKFG